jgi:hypothetical protein
LALGSNRKTILGPREEKSWTTLNYHANGPCPHIHRPFLSDPSGLSTHQYTTYRCELHWGFHQEVPFVLTGAGQTMLPVHWALRVCWVPGTVPRTGSLGLGRQRPLQTGGRRRPLADQPLHLLQIHEEYGVNVNTCRSNRPLLVITKVQCRTILIDDSKLSSDSEQEHTYRYHKVKYARLEVLTAVKTPMLVFRGSDAVWTCRPKFNSETLVSTYESTV